MWVALGKVIKEGLYEDHDNKEKILDISLFKSTKTNELITLQDYVDQFAEGHIIYYLSTENAESWHSTAPIWRASRRKALMYCCFPTRLMISG